LIEKKDSMYSLKRYGKELSETERISKYKEFIERGEKIETALIKVRIVDPAV